MKKTFTININGSVFHIDDDAFDKLQRYLHMLNQHFSVAVEGQEILQDIEARIAELLIERTNNKLEVVTDAMVEEVIDRMGKPEDFMDQAEEEPSAKPQPEAEPKIRQRLYRDGDSRVIGGVCSGMSAYFNLDVVILRILFVVAIFISFGTGLVAYLVLWIAVPKAKTTAQKLEMKGKEATVSNIEKTIKEEVNEVSENYNRYKNSASTGDAGLRRERFGDVVTSVFKVVLRVLVLVLGAALVIGAIVGLISFVATMAVGNSFLNGGIWHIGGGHDIEMGTLINNFVSPGSYTILMITIGLLVGIPILLILFAGTKLIFRYKTNNKLIGLGAFGVWLVALVVMIVVGVNQAGNFAKQTSQTITQKVDCTSFKTLYLETSEDLYESLIDHRNISFNRMKVAQVNGKDKVLGHPSFTIEKSTSGEYSLLIKKRSRGNNTSEAQNNIEQIEYNFSQKDSTLRLDPYYFLKDNAKWRDQEITMILKVPEGKSVYLSKSMGSIVDDISNTENMWDGDMLDKVWTMKAEGLSLKKDVPVLIKK